MAKFYRDVRTGESLIRISKWETFEGEELAYFKANTGAVFSMVKGDIEEIE